MPTKLAHVSCPRCGYENPELARFCTNCGADLVRATDEGEERKLVSVTQTRTRGRAAIAKLTPDGKKLSAQLMQVSLQRQARLFKNFTKADKERLRAMLTQLAQNLTGADGEQ